MRSSGRSENTVKRLHDNEFKSYREGIPRGVVDSDVDDRMSLRFEKW